MDRLAVLGESRVVGLPWPDLNDGLVCNDVLPPADSGMTLIGFYSTKYKCSAPLQGWLQRIHNGQITLDSHVTKSPQTILRAGARLTYRRLPWKEPDTPYLLTVLYEDSDMIALDKPSGLQVLPGGLFQQQTVLTQLQWLLAQCFFQTANDLCCVPVHHLGRGTSGILLCAKTKFARIQLAAYFADKTSSISKL